MSPASRDRRLATVYFAHFAYVGALSPYFGLYLQSIGNTAWQIGVLLGAMQLCRVFAPSLWAAAADRGERRAYYLRRSALLSAIAFTGLFFTESFPALLVVLVIHAACNAGTNPLLETITLAALKDRIARYGTIRLWGSVGFVVAVTVLGFQLDRLPIASLLPAVLALLCMTWLATLAVPEAPPRARPAPVSLAPILRDPGLRRLLAACFLMTIAHGPLYAFFSIHLAEHGYAKSAIGALWSLGVVAEIVVFWLQPRWAGKISMESVFVASLACAVARFLLIAWGIEHAAVVLVAQVLHGATFGAYHVAALALVHRRFGEGARARGQALYTSVSFGAGGVAGAFGSGWAWDALGPAWTFTLASVAAGAGLLLAGRGRRIAT